LWFVIVPFALGAIFIRVTPWGRHIYAIGANRQAAYLSGLPTRWLPFWLYVATGMAAGLTGILLTARLDGMTPGQTGLTLEIQVLTVVLLGGVAFAGGRGRLFGVLVAWLFLATLQDGLVLLNVAPAVQLVASGLALAFAAAIDMLGSWVTERMEARRRTELQLSQARSPDLRQRSG
jgi:ribose/xylose/arabinose/galactoside ABC-type transport system permease subunit